MNFAKKSISIALAAMMALTSLFAGTTAFAATPVTYTPTAAADQAFSANPVRVEKTDDDGNKYKVIENNPSYFSFTPATTGMYQLKVDTAPLYENTVSYTNEFGNTDTMITYTAAPVAGAISSYRIDSAEVTVYKDAERVKDSIAYAETENIAGNYVYDANYDYVKSDINALQHFAGYDTVKLIGGQTYYISVRASFDYVIGDWNEAIQDNNIEYHNTTGTFTIAPTDWTMSRSSETQDVFVPVPATSKYVINIDEYNDYGEYDYVQLINGAYYVKETIDTNFTAGITYVGTALDVVAPSTINGYPVKAVAGTTNEAIKSLALSAGIKEIGGFYELYNLAAVTLNNDLERINSDCFTNDRALTSIAIPGSVKTIGGSAFSGCTALAAASIGNGVKEIGSYAFYNTALSGVMIPASVVSIGSFAFGYVSNLNTFTVNPTDTIETLKDGFAIGGASTEAYNYAVKNGINYVDATNGCTHAYNTATVPATLFAKGSKTSVCPICGATETKSINKKTFKISSLKSSKKGTIVVKAAKQEGIAGYKVEYSTSKKFTKKTTKTVTVKSTKALSKTIKGLKSGKKYYVRVRAYNKANGKTVYSKYTAVKSVKVK